MPLNKILKVLKISEGVPRNLEIPQNVLQDRRKYELIKLRKETENHLKN